MRQPPLVRLSAVRGMGKKSAMGDWGAGWFRPLLRARRRYTTREGDASRYCLVFLPAAGSPVITGGRSLPTSVLPLAALRWGPGQQQCYHLHSLAQALAMQVKQDGVGSFVAY